MNAVLPRMCLSGSWTRCESSYQLNRAEEWETHVLSQPELRFISTRTARLMRNATAEMKRLHSLVSPLGFAVLLADPDGIVLSRLASPTDLTGCRRWRFQPGAVWNEEHAGTNAIGTCLLEQRPVMVMQEQHWRLCFRKLTGIAVPLYNAAGVLAGVIDISSFRSSDFRPAAALLLDALLTAGRRVEEQLFRDSFPAATIVTLGPSDLSSTPLLALNAEGGILGATCAARHHLSLSEKDLSVTPPVMPLLTSSDTPDFRQAEASVIRSALALTNGNISEAARSLGISRATLHRKIRKTGLGH